MTALGRTALPLLIAVTAVPLSAQTPPNPPVSPGAAALIRDVVYNELHDREHDSHWEYRSEVLTPGKDLVREQVETGQGPIFRVLELNGTPLNASQTEQEERRIDAYVHNPSEIARVEHSHEEDESRVARVVGLLPDAMLFTSQGPPSGDVEVLNFVPNPAYVPPTYEARLVHALTGTVTVNLRLKRMIEMRGVVAERVDFGYGILGHVEQGGTFVIHRQQVSDTRWKTDLVDVRLQGKILLLKTLDKHQREVRSDFHPVPQGTTVTEAKNMLDAAAQTTQAQLTPASMQRQVAANR
jgi:hypothetical protein